METEIIDWNSPRIKEKRGKKILVSDLQLRAMAGAVKLYIKAKKDYEKVSGPEQDFKYSMARATLSSMLMILTNEKVGVDNEFDNIDFDADNWLEQMREALQQIY